jgi:hypothetical protein
MLMFVGLASTPGGSTGSDASKPDGAGSFSCWTPAENPSFGQQRHIDENDQKDPSKVAQGRFAAILGPKMRVEIATEASPLSPG